MHAKIADWVLADGFFFFVKYFFCKNLNILNHFSWSFIYNIKISIIVYFYVS